MHVQCAGELRAPMLQLCRVRIHPRGLGGPRARRPEFRGKAMPGPGYAYWPKPSPRASALSRSVRRATAG